MKYEIVEAGKWIKPIKRGYLMACCDCGLVHRVDFEHIKWGRGRKIILRAWRDEKETKRVRTTMKREKGKV